VGSTGSLAIGVSAGFVLMIILGWLPIVGPLIAGVVAGLMAEGGLRRGAVTGLLAGTFGGVALALILTSVDPATFAPLGFSVDFLGSFMLAILSVGGTIGALIGGALAGLVTR
jgi:hypothetical protein